MYNISSDAIEAFVESNMDYGMTHEQIKNFVVNSHVTDKRKLRQVLTEVSTRNHERKKLLLDNALRTNETNVASAWSSFQSSESALTSVRSQVNAAEIANEGITVEYETGLGRTTLDVIQSNTILLTSRINLANSERNFFLSQLELLKSVGLLNAKYLKIVK